jgi:hypothetical protein
MRKSNVLRTAAPAVALLLSACAQETRAPGEFEANALGALNEASIRGAAVAWFNVASGQRLFEIRLQAGSDRQRHIVLTSAVEEWPAPGTYQITENAPGESSFDLLFTLDANRIVRATRGTVEILESERGEVTGRFSADGVLIDMASPGAGMPAVKLTGTFRATCSEVSGETDC